MRTFLALFLVLAVPAVAQTSAPTFSFQGTLAESGTPVADGTYAVTVGLHDAATGGAPLYAEDHSVSTVGGQFALTVGGGSATTGSYDAVTFADETWIEVSVGGTPLGPRTLIQAVPHARSLTAGAAVQGAVTFGPVLSVTNLATESGGGTGVYGLTSALEGRGVYGEATATTGLAYGVYGTAASNSARGVYGEATSSSSLTYGVYGRSASTDGRGVYGFATSNNGMAYGVHGRSQSSDGRGVYGFASASSGGTFGVFGESASTDGRGVYGFASASSGDTYGVYGTSRSTVGNGVYGSASASSGFTSGVRGQAVSDGGTGVFGVAISTSNTLTFGVRGQTSSGAGRGVSGEAIATTGTAVGVYGRSAATSGRGVSGQATATSGTTYGVFGSSASPSGYALYGTGSATTGNAFGVYGQSQSISGTAVYGFASALTGTTFGVRSVVNSPDGYPGYFTGGRGVYVDATGSSHGAEVLNDGGAGFSTATVYAENASTGNGIAGWFEANGTDAALVAYQRSSGDIFRAIQNSNLRFRVQANGDVTADGTFTGGGADFAEYFPLASSSARPRAGDVVGVTAGRVGLATDAAEQIMIVSSNPAFVGNPDAAEDGALVALVGQAEVRLASPAQIGDLLVASGANDGLARAVSPARYDPAADGPVAGRILELADNGMAVALVGVDETAALRAVVISQQDELATQQRQLDAQQSQIDALVQRLDALDRQPNTPSAVPSPPQR